MPDAFDGIALHTHDGSALTFYINMILVPEHDFAVVICTNAFSMPAVIACSETLLSLLELHLDAEARRQAGNPDGPVENASIGVRYNTIQTAIDYAEGGETIVIAPGIYHETIDLTDKNIILRSTDSNLPSSAAHTVLLGDGTIPVVLLSGNTQECILQGLTVKGGSVGVRVVGGIAEITGCCIVENNGAGLELLDEAQPSINNCLEITGCCIVENNGAGLELLDEAQPSINNCLVANNSGAGIAMPSKTEGRKLLHSSPNVLNCTIVENGKEAILNGHPVIVNSILYNNVTSLDMTQISSDLASVTYSDVQGGWPGEGNIITDPLFVDPENGDYHLKSQAGRWDLTSQSWILDDVTSPCIDAGNPNTSFGSEPGNNGGIINMGAYGGTSEASKSL
jgi:hypothetical protein